MDTPTIAQYYREHDPLKRKQLLDASIAQGEEPENNEIRKKIWELRYKDKAETGGDARADGFLALWMILEFNRNAGNKFFGARGAKKDIEKQLKKLHFQEFANGGEWERELLYRECCHLVKTYMELCESDKSYTSMLCGIMSMSDDKAKAKLQKDMYETAIILPASLGMEKELELVVRAAKEMYELHFPGEGGLE